MGKNGVIIYEALCESVSILMETGMEFFDAVICVAEESELSEEQIKRFNDALWTRKIGVEKIY